MKFNSNNYKLLKPDKYLLTKQTDFTKNININETFQPFNNTTVTYYLKIEKNSMNVALYL